MQKNKQTPTNQNLYQRAQSQQQFQRSYSKQNKNILVRTQQIKHRTDFTIRIDPQTAQSRNFHEPGLYFDEDQQYLTQKMHTLQNKNLHTGPKNPFANGEKFQKLFSPYGYVQYVNKLGQTKQSYINSLQQLGYDMSRLLKVKQLNTIMNKTQNIIKKSYSVKYIGVIDNSMGILSRRVKLSSGKYPQHQTNSNKLQYTYQQNINEDPLKSKYKSQDDNLNSLGDQQNFQENSTVQQANLNNLEQNIQSPQSQNQNININNYLKDGFQTTLQTQGNSTDVINQNATDNIQIQENDQQEGQQAVVPVPQPYSFNNYLVTKYSLGKYLKTLRKEKDTEKLIIQDQLDEYHSLKIKSYVSPKFVPTLTEMQKQIEIQRQIKKGRIKMGRKKPLQNYQESDEGVCYAIIDRPVEKPTISYSRMLTKIGQDKQQQEQQMQINTQQNQQYSGQDNYQTTYYTQQFSQTTTESNKLDIFTKNLAYSQNEQFFDRFDKIKQKQQFNQQLKYQTIDQQFHQADPQN